MAIKKGLAVVDSAGVVVHKLLDDGSVELGKTGSEVRFASDFKLTVNNDGQDLRGLMGPINNTFGETTSNLQNANAEEYYFSGENFASIQQSVVGYNVALDTQHGWNGPLDNALYAAYQAENQAKDTAKANELAEIADLKTKAVADYNAVETDHNTEIGDRQGQFAVLVSKINTEKDRVNALMTVDNVLNDIDTFGEVVEYLNGIDTANDAARATQFSTLSSSLDTEIAARGANHGAAMAWSLVEMGERGTGVSTAESKLSTQVSRREEAIVSLTTHASDALTFLDTHNGYRDTATSAMIFSEGQDQVAGDSSIQTDIDSFESAWKGQFLDPNGVYPQALGQELMNRKTAKSSLQTLISDEESAFATAHLSLNTAKSTLSSSAASDLSSLQTRLSNELAAEKVIYEADDTALSANITAETNARTTAFAGIDSDIASAAQNVVNVQAGYDSANSTEVATINSDYSTYSTRVSGIEGDIDNLISSAGIDADQFKEIVAYLTSEDSDTSGDLVTAFNTFTSDVGDEAALRTTGDSTLATNLSNEEAAVNSAKTSMQVRDGVYAGELATQSSQRAASHIVEHGVYTAHATARKAAMLAAVDTEENTAQATTGNQAGAINTEHSNRSAAINAELQAASIADTAMLSTLSDFASNGFSGANVNVNGPTTLGSLEVGASGRMSVVETSIPAAFATGDQSGNNGKMFYLNVAAGFSAQGPFVENNKWYFCEMGTWHMSPFYSEDS
jgi:hypothetical protein